MSAGDPRVPAAAASPVVTRLRDGGGGACDAHTASLFASVQRPTPLASETLARIQDGLDRATRAGAARAPRNHRMVAAAAAFLVGAVCAGALHNVLARRDQAIPAGLRVVVLGSGSASSDAGGTVRVEHGRVAVRTGDRGVQVRASSARIEVHAASVVEIDSAEERVACYEGSAAVAWNDGPLITLSAGFSTARSGQAAAAARRDEVMRAVGSDTGELPPARPARESARVESRAVGAALPATPAQDRELAVPGQVASAASTSPSRPAHSRRPQQQPALASPAKTLVAPTAAPTGAAVAPVAAAAPVEGRTEAMTEASDTSDRTAAYRIVADAMRLLRREHRPLAALAVLDEYARRFPDPGRHLGPEADTVRVEVLIALNRKSEALAILDRKVAAGVAVDRALHVLRGELLAASGRCREALTEATPAAESDDALGERASYVSAVCHVKLGHAAQGRLALVGYLRRFPSGRYADEVRRVLGR